MTTQKAIRMTKLLKEVARHPELKVLADRKIEWLENIHPWETSGVSDWLERAKVAVEMHLFFVGKPYGPEEQKELSLYVGIEFADELEPLRIKDVPCIEGMHYTRHGFGVIGGGKV